MPLPALLPLLLAGGSGALLGGLAAGGPESISGKPGGLKQLPTVTPGQENIIGQSGKGALDLLKQIQGSQFNFEPIAQQARTQFQTQTIPSIAERFSSMGTGGSQRSSAFSNALGSAGSGLEQSLAALRSQYGLQERGLNQQLLNSLLGVGLTPTFQSYYQPQQQGALAPILSALAGGLGMALPGGFGQLGQLSGLFSGSRAAASQPNYLSQANQPYLGGGGFNNPNVLSPNLLALAGGF